MYSCYLTFGSAVHDALEKYKSNEDEIKLSLNECIEKFEESFREKYLKIRDRDKKPLSDEEIEEWVLAGKRILTNIDNCSKLSEATVLFVEYQLLEPIDRTDDVKIKFKGFIDIVIKSKDKRGKTILFICDYKTCTWGWTVEKKRDENLQMQLRLYKYFFCKKFKLNHKEVRTAFILLKRTPKDEKNVADFFEFSSGPKTMMRAVDKLNKAITGMQTNDYKKNRNACINKWGDTCPYYQTDLCTKD